MTAAQRCWYITLRDHGPAGFLAEANYTDTTADQSLILEIERKTLLIKSAVLEVHRGQSGAPASQTISNLEGITAYFGSGRQLRQALGGNSALLDMAVQAVSTVIQGEAFFCQERGFASLEAYDDYWDKIAKDSCVYYSNLDRLSHRFNDYIENQRRGSNLFHRYLLTAIETNSGESTEIRSHLLDSYHEMSIALQLESGFRVSNVSAAMLRCPDSVCCEALERLDRLKGTLLTTADMKRYRTDFGGASGCTHIAHLVQEAAYTLDIFKNMK